MRRFAFLGIGLVLWANQARAQSSTAAAVQLFDEGRAALQRGDLDVACSKFQESNRLGPAIGTAFNLANCEEQRGRLATAWALFREVAGRMQPDDPRLAVANERIAALDRRVPRIVLTATESTPKNARVRVDDLELISASFGSAIPLDPGQHRIVIRMLGAQPRSSELTLKEGETVSVPVTPPSEQAMKDNPRTRSGRFLGMSREEALWITAGIGAAGLLAGAVAGGIGLNAQAVGDSSCNDATKTCSQRGYDANQRAKALAVVSTVGFGVAILGAGAATYVYFAVPSGDDPRTATLGVRGQW